MFGYMGNYDEWKTACCGLYPNCGDCPFANEDEESEEEYLDD